MKRRKLRKWVKVVITLLVLLFSIYVYERMAILGIDADKNMKHQMLCVIGWVWLFLGQFATIWLLWENDNNYNFKDID